MLLWLKCPEAITPLSQKAQRGCSGGSIQSRDSTIVGCCMPIMSKKYQGMALKCIWLSISQNQSLASAIQLPENASVIGSVKALEAFINIK